MRRRYSCDTSDDGESGDQAIEAAINHAFDVFTALLMVLLVFVAGLKVDILDLVSSLGLLDILVKIGFLGLANH